MDLIEWIDEKHKRIVNVIPAASDDPWTLHGPAHLCVGCLPLFVPTYLADVPEIISQSEVLEMLESGELTEEDYG